MSIISRTSVIRNRKIIGRKKKDIATQNAVILTENTTRTLEKMICSISLLVVQVAAS